MKKTLLILAYISILLLSCKKKDDDYKDDGISYGHIYKIKDTSYFSYVPVWIKKDISRIISIPDKRTQEKWIGKPILLDSSYYYEPANKKTGAERYFAYGAENTAILDIKLSDYHDSCNSHNMLLHIKAHDLFTDFYQHLDTFISSVSSFEHDTALINRWIRNGELGKHMKKIK